MDFKNRHYMHVTSASPQPCCKEKNPYDSQKEEYSSDFLSQRYSSLLYFLLSLLLYYIYCLVWRKWINVHAYDIITSVKIQNILKSQYVLFCSLGIFYYLMVLFSNFTCVPHLSFRPFSVLITRPAKNDYGSKILKTFK